MTAKANGASFLPCFRLDGCTGLVNGAGAAIGAEIVTAFEEAGAEVVFVSLHQDELEAAASKVKVSGGKMEIRLSDVTKSDAVRSLIIELQTLDILVNNGGTNIPVPFVDMADKHPDFMSDINISACRSRGGPNGQARRALASAASLGRSTTL